MNVNPISKFIGVNQKVFKKITFFNLSLRNRLSVRPNIVNIQKFPETERYR